MLFFEQKPYNMHWEAIECLEQIYKILDDLEDTRITLIEEKEITDILYPPFNPFKTTGKY